MARAEIRRAYPLRSTPSRNETGRLQEAGRPLATRQDASYSIKTGGRLKLSNAFKKRSLLMPGAAIKKGRELAKTDNKMKQSLATLSKCRRISSAARKEAFAAHKRLKVQEKIFSKELKGDIKKLTDDFKAKRRALELKQIDLSRNFKANVKRLGNEKGKAFATKFANLIMDDKTSGMAWRKARGVTSRVQYGIVKKVSKAHA